MAAVEEGATAAMGAETTVAGEAEMTEDVAGAAMMGVRAGAAMMADEAGGAAGMKLPNAAGAGPRPRVPVRPSRRVGPSP